MIPLGPPRSSRTTSPSQDPKLGPIYKVPLPYKVTLSQILNSGTDIGEGVGSVTEPTTLWLRWFRSDWAARTERRTGGGGTCVVQGGGTGGLDACHRWGMKQPGCTHASCWDAPRISFFQMCTPMTFW